MHNYLEGHTQQVVIRRADGTVLKSISKSNDLGVYQGGSLSCMLYTLFSNDLSLYVQDDVIVVQYADDVQVLTSGRKQDIGLLRARMEKSLRTLNQWFCQHRTKLNEAKTQLIVMGTPAMLRGMEPVTLEFNGAQIEPTRVVKNLGVMFDSHLKFADHIDTVVKTCTGSLIALSHARHAIPKSVLPCLVQALTISIVRYCMSAYGTCNDTQLHRIQKILNFCARVVSGRKKRDHISDVTQRLGWMSAKQLVSYHSVCSVQSMLFTGQPEALRSTIGPPANTRHSHETRNAGQLTLPHIRTEAGRRRLCYHGVMSFNELKFNYSSVNFRRSLKKAIMSQPP